MGNGGRSAAAPGGRLVPTMATEPYNQIRVRISMVRFVASEVRRVRGGGGGEAVASPTMSGGAVAGPMASGSHGQTATGHMVACEQGRTRPVMR
jgi:hypothetical protein